MEKVQLSLERFIPELRDLQRKNIFNTDEINSIVSKRRQHEITLAKKDVKPIDYLNYIDYEKSLEKLRKLRSKRIKTTTKKTLSDYSISSHITHLFTLSVRRFPSSLLLWDSSISHSFSSSSPLLISRTLSSAIALNPTIVRYWLAAIRFESDGMGDVGGGNEEGARKLIMRALRFIRGEESEKLWLEWVKVEVGFVERLRKRWDVLGIGKSQVEVPEEDVEMDELEVEKEVAVEQDAGKESILGGSIVRVVLTNFLATHPTLSTYHTLFTLLRSLSSPLRPSLLSHTYTLLSHSSLSLSDRTRILADGYLLDALEGEEYVEAVRKGVEGWWEVVRGTKGEEERVAFAEWMMGIDSRGNADLAEYVSLSLQRLFKRSSSLSLSLLHLSFLRSSSSPLPPSLTSHLLSLLPSAPKEEKEVIFLALLSAPSEDLYKQAIAAVPSSIPLWSSYVTHIQSSSSLERQRKWWKWALETVCSTEAKGAREAVFRMWANTRPSEKETEWAVRNLATPTSFLRTIEREEVFELIVRREGGEMEDWVRYAKWLLGDGRTEECMKVVERARKKGRERGWEEEFVSRWRGIE